MPRTIQEITKDFQSYRKLAKKQGGVTVYADKYVEDVGTLLAALKVDTTPVAAAPAPDKGEAPKEEDTKDIVKPKSSKSSKAKTSKA